MLTAGIPFGIGGETNMLKVHVVGESEEMDIDQLLSDLPTMRQHYKDYNPVTAREIIEALPRAWALHCDEGGRWGPGFIAKVYSLNSTTIGRYCGAFKKAGLEEVEGIEIP